jgi:hypothetical protein
VDGELLVTITTPPNLSAMAPTLGKRKRISRAELERQSRSPSLSSGSSDSGGDDLQAIFRRAFEAKFQPLAGETKKPKMEITRIQEGEGDREEEGMEEGEEDSDWSGISEEEGAVQVIEYTGAQLERDGTSKAELRAFMSNRPPASTTVPSKAPTVTKKQSEGDLTESTNLKNDLALQKLLRESHLLAASASSSGTSTPTLSTTGIARHKSTDLHLQSLGAKGSVFTQKKMPMAQRKHMIQKARLTDEKQP